MLIALSPLMHATGPVESSKNFSIPDFAKVLLSSYIAEILLNQLRCQQQTSDYLFKCSPSLRDNSISPIQIYPIDTHRG